MEADEEFLTAGQVSDAIEKRFGVKVRQKTIVNYAAAGRFAAVKVGVAVRYTASSVARYLNAPPPAKLTPRKPRQAAAQPQHAAPASAAPEPPPATPARPKRQRAPRGWIPV